MELDANLHLDIVLTSCLLAQQNPGKHFNFFHPGSTDWFKINNKRGKKKDQKGQFVLSYLPFY